MAKNRIPVNMSEKEWETIVNGLNLKPTTINDYRKVINLLHRYENGKYQIQTMTKEQANEYFTYLDKREEDGELSGNTVHRYQATLRSVGAFMEEHKTLWPNYVNPFSCLVRNETRARTRFTDETFANPEEVKKLLMNLDKLDPQDAIIITLMTNLGITPAQIQQLKMSAFSRRKLTPEIPLTANIDTGTFLETTNKPPKESPYRTGGYPVRYVRKSPGRTITWKYVGTFTFTHEYREVLLSRYETLGLSTDARKLFFTQRHLEFNYRAMHHMILQACETVGLVDSSITPYQLSLYGMVRSYLVFNARKKKEHLEVELASEHNEARKKELTLQKETMEKILDELNFFEIIGDWEERFPIPYEIQVDAIQKQMGTDYLLKIVGINDISIPVVLE